MTILQDIQTLDVTLSAPKTAEALERALSDHPADAELYALVKSKMAEAEAYFERPLDSEAFYAALEKAAAARGDAGTAAHAKRQLGRRRADELHIEAYRQAFFGNNARASELYAQALAACSDHELANKDAPKAQNRIEKAKKNIAKSESAAASGAAEDLMALGADQLDLGRTEDAIKTFERARAAAPDDLDAHNRLGCALASAGRLQDAKSIFEGVLAKSPKNMTAKRGMNYVSFMLDA